jgi:hypothetical protein
MPEDEEVAALPSGANASKTAQVTRPQTRFARHLSRGFKIYLGKIGYTPTLGEPEKAPCESVLPRF